MTKEQARLVIQSTAVTLPSKSSTTRRGLGSRYSRGVLLLIIVLCLAIAVLLSESKNTKRYGYATTYGITTEGASTASHHIFGEYVEELEKDLFQSQSEYNDAVLNGSKGYNNEKGGMKELKRKETRGQREKAAEGIGEKKLVNEQKSKLSNNNATTTSLANERNITQQPRAGSRHRTKMRQQHEYSPLAEPLPSNFSTDIDIVSLTVSDDFFILFNNSAVTSWIKYIQNVRSITFIGPSKDYDLFNRNMQQHYPHLLPSNKNIISDDAQHFPPIRWVNETHFMKYRKKYRCPYPQVCQQLIKLYVFDLRTNLGLDYIGDNILIVDSDTVWSRNATFVHPDGRVQYWEATGTYDSNDCMGMDPVKFTEAITMGPSNSGKATLTPYRACKRPEYPNATGARHIVHHMLFQYDVMMALHDVISKRWKAKTLWQAFNYCHIRPHCDSRIAEYELYFAFVSENYPDRVRLERLTNGENYMGSSAICNAREMKCCEEKGVLLKGCHDHRIKAFIDSKGSRKSSLGDMCCQGNDAIGITLQTIQ